MICKSPNMSMPRDGICDPRGAMLLESCAPENGYIADPPAARRGRSQIIRG
jgi:hypothetical protein